MDPSQLWSEGDVTMEEVHWMKYEKDSTLHHGFDDGRRESGAKECGQPLKPRKGKKTDSPYSFPARNAALLKH